MKLSEIFKEGIDPKVKVRVKEWPDWAYVCFYFKDIQDNVHGIDHEKTYYVHFLHNNHGWEIYTEPKPVVKRAKYIYKCADDSGYCDTNSYYIDDDDFLSDFPKETWYKRLQEIECPE
jgi:hypothetical protein